jgi:CDP-glucose 4,6-dehydratase
MYSSSKGCAEILSSSYRRSFLQNGGFALATARAGNVIGGGDWALDRLVPDCIRSIEAGQPIEIRSPRATRPWQHVLEPLGGYLLVGHLLCTKGKTYAQAFNFGPQPGNILTVEEVARQIIAAYGKGSLLAKQESPALHEATLLTLDITKAKNDLGWQPMYSAEQAIACTTDWYKHFYQGQAMRAFTLQQIHQYEEKLPWNKN